MANPRLVLSLLLAVLLILPAGAARAQGQIRLNQIGFHPGDAKVAAVVGGGTSFLVLTSDRTDTLLQASLGPASVWPYSQESVRLADCSAVQREGSYVLFVPGVGSSHPFDIRPHAYQSLTVGALKGFYYQRASMRLYPLEAGIWTRSAGHPDTAVRIHPSAATATRPAGSTIRSPWGWYDAGDYNKYVGRQAARVKLCRVTDVILLEGIQILAALGVTAAERRSRRPVLLDVEVERDLRGAGRSDRIGQTIHYKRIYEVVEDVAANQEHKLVEALAERIARAVLEKFEAQAVTISVRKPTPIAGVLQFAGVRIRRSREDLR